MLSPWGKLSVAVPSAELGARLYDTALVWRTMRKGKLEELGDSGEPNGGDCLPPPQLDELPAALLNFPAVRYLGEGDAALMEFLGRASFTQLEARLRQVALEAGRNAAERHGGLRGLKFEKGWSKIGAVIRHAGRQHLLGYFGSKEEAGCVYDAATIWWELQKGGA